MTRSVRLDAEGGEVGSRLEADVCVIGAGAAGCYLGARLAQAGRDVLVLEAGTDAASDPESAGFATDFGIDPYPGATEGRAFGLGGSTARWGGLLVPHSSLDLRASGGVGDETWGEIVETVRRRSAAVLGMLGRTAPGRFEDAFADVDASTASALDAVGLAVVMSLYLPFRRKNLRFLLERGDFARSPRVVTRAAACAWKLNPNGQLEEVEARTTSGRSLRIRADRFVVAAGAIESARLLLELERDLPAGSALSPEVGVGLADHLSVAIADVPRHAIPEAVARFAPNFEGVWMRGARFVERDAGADAPRSFAHFVFDNTNPGFQLAKNVLTSLQARRMPRVGVGDLFAGVGGAVRLAHARYARNRLFLPDDVPTRLQLDVEQGRSASNRIMLGEEADRFDRPVPMIDWTIGAEDVDRVRESAHRLLGRWSASNGALPELEPRDLDFASEKPHDAYHPVGVCRMGGDSRSVVDPSLGLRGVDNVWVVSTGVLPTAGTANPTFTMLCLAEELATRLTARG